MAEFCKQLLSIADIARFYNEGSYTHQYLFGGNGPDDAAEVAEVCRAHLAHVEQRVDAQGRESVQKQPLRHLSPNERRHFGQQLKREENKARIKTSRNRCYCRPRGGWGLIDNRVRNLNE